MNGPVLADSALDALRAMAMQHGQHLAHPVAAWQPGSRRAGRPLHRAAVAAVITCTVASGAYIGADRHLSARAMDSPRVALASSAPLPEAFQLVQAVKAPARIPAQRPEVRSAKRQRNHVEFRAGDVRMQLRNVPFGEAVRSLATATHAALRGPQESWAQLPPVSMEWQGIGADAAWQRLLRDRVSYASQCDAVGCTVWIAGPLSTRAASPAVARTPTPAAPLEHLPAVAVSELDALMDATGSTAVGQLQ